MKINHTLYQLTAAIALMTATNIAAQTLQEVSGHLEMTGRFADGKVQLRWAPDNPVLFGLVKTKGYVLEKFDPTTKTYKKLADLRPLTLAEFETKSDTSDINVATVAQALWGKAATPSISRGTGPLAAALAEKEEKEQRFAFALLAADFSQKAASALGVFYEDSDVKEGNTYWYRVYAKDLPQNLIKTDTAGISINTKFAAIKRKTEDVIAVADDNQIILKWPKQPNNSHFTGYYIERSDDKGKNFKRLNAYPSVGAGATPPGQPKEIFNLFHDRTCVPAVEYRYRIVGITPFGDLGLPSDVVTVTLPDSRGPVPPFNLRAKDEGKKGITLSWQINPDDNDVTGFHVARSDVGTGPFVWMNEKPLAAKTTTYTDATAPAFKESYYVVYAVDKDGHQSPSNMCVGKRLDSIAPAKPLNFAGRIDTTGLVSLAWSMGKEPDLYGYKVFYANSRNREFYQVNSDVVQGNVFFDLIDLNTLSEKIYYYIVAVDFNYNVSERSEILELDKPDIVPPTAPVFKRYAAGAKEVSLTWARSQSADAMYYYLLRKGPDDEKYDVLTILPAADSTYTDKTVLTGKTYMYSIITVDDAALASEPALPIVVTCADDGIRPGIADLKGELKKNPVGFGLSWSKPPGSEQAMVRIYRNNNGKGLELIATVKAGENTYLDSSIYNNQGRFDYAVKVIYPDGGESGLSNVVSLQSKP